MLLMNVLSNMYMYAHGVILISVHMWSYSHFSMKRKRQLEFTGEKTAMEDMPPLPSFPDEILQ